MIKLNFKLVRSLLLVLLGLSLLNNTFGFTNAQGSSIKERINGLSHTTEKVTELINGVDGLFNNVNQNQTLQSILNGVEVDLPVSILPGDNNAKYQIILENITLGTEGSKADLYFRLEVNSDPNLDTKDRYLYFAAFDVAFTKAGGFSGEGRLDLISAPKINFGKDISLDLEDSGNGTIDFVENSHSPTYIEFDCDGFLSLNVEGNLIFKSSAIVLEDANGKPKKGKDVEIPIKTNVQDWNEMSITFNLPRFQFTALPGYSFEIENGVLDHNEFQTPAEVEFPSGYLTEPREMWQGVYFEGITGFMPTEFQNRDVGERLELMIANLIIDDQGVTGDFTIKNLLTLEDGVIGGWAFSIDKFAISLDRGSLKASPDPELEGRILLPIMNNEGEQSGLSYTADVYEQTNGDLGYTFVAVTENNIDFTAFHAANVELTRGSMLEINVVGGAFEATAILNGKAVIGGEFKPAGYEDDKEKRDYQIAIAFEQMKLSTSKPYFGIKSAVIDAGISKKENKLNSFPVQLHEVGFDSRDDGDEIGLVLDVGISLMGNNDESSGNDFGIDTKFTVWGSFNTDSRLYSYKETTLEGIGIDVDNGTYSFKGKLERLTGDLKGWSACVEAKFEPGITVNASSVFGTQEETEIKFWGVDAGVIFPEAIPIFSGLGINGFNGGATHHLAQVESNIPGSFDITGDCNATAKIFMVEPNNYLSIEAGLEIIGQPNKDVLNGKVALKFDFGEDKQLREVVLTGLVKMISEFKSGDIADLAETVKNPPSFPEDAESSDETSSIMANWLVKYNFREKELAGTFNVFINAGILKGPYENNRAGTISIYFKNPDWHIYVGTAAEPIALTMESFMKTEASTYMVVGTRLPTPKIAAFPPEIEGFNPTDGYSDELSREGAGIAFGARGKAGTKWDNGFKIVGCGVGINIGVDVGVGFDIMVVKSKEPVKCDGDERGMNGWYGTGQAYISANASVDFEYSCFLSSGEITLIELGLYAAMFAQLPNPIFIKGQVGVRAKVLFINVNVKVDGEIGDQCEDRDKDSPESITLIRRVFPQNESTGQDLFVTPIISLVYPDGYDFEIPDNNASSRLLSKKEVRIKVPLDFDKCDSKNKVWNYNLTTGEKAYLVKMNGEVEASEKVAGCFEINSNGDEVKFVPARTLEPGTRYRLVFTVKTNITGIEEAITTTFTTAETEVTTISTNNIKYSYPLPDMKNFYPDESPNGYLQMSVLQTKALESEENHVFEVRYEKAGETVFSSRDVILEDELGVHHLRFPIPTNLEVKTGYTFSIVQTPLERDPEDIDYDPGIATQTITKEQNEEDDFVVVEYNFTTSSFRTFNEKFANHIHQDVTVNADQGVVYMNFEELEVGDEGGTEESLTKTEFLGRQVKGETQLPLVRFTANLSSSISSAGNYVQGLSESLNDGRGKDHAVEEAIFIHAAGAQLSISYEIPKYIKDEIERITRDKKYSKITVSASLEAGTHTYQIHYYLPGQTIPSSSANVGFVLPETIDI